MNLHTSRISQARNVLDKPTFEQLMLQTTLKNIDKSKRPVFIPFDQLKTYQLIYPLLLSTPFVIVYFNSSLRQRLTRWIDETFCSQAYLDDRELLHDKLSNAKEIVNPRKLEFVWRSMRLVSSSIDAIMMFSISIGLEAYFKIGIRTPLLTLWAIKDFMWAWMGAQSVGRSFTGTILVSDTGRASDDSWSLLAINMVTISVYSCTELPFVLWKYIFSKFVRNPEKSDRWRRRTIGFGKISKLLFLSSLLVAGCQTLFSSKKRDWIDNLANARIVTPETYWPKEIDHPWEVEPLPGERVTKKESQEKRY